jgi:hypothetical protein
MRALSLQANLIVTEQLKPPTTQNEIKDSSQRDVQFSPDNRNEEPSAGNNRLENLDVFISSPGDVQLEREVAKRVIDKINLHPNIAGRFRLNILDYQRSVPATIGNLPQLTVDDYMMKADECDVFICILWTRMGTPVVDPLNNVEYESGTSYEFSHAYQANQSKGTPSILLYQGKRYFDPDSVDLEQYRRVKRFFTDFEGKEAKFKGIFKSYASVEQFEEILYNDLEIILQRNFIGTSEIEKPYLEWLIRQHSRLELRGIKNAEKAPAIPLDRVYVALRGIKAALSSDSRAINCSSLRLQSLNE